jgi:hypothetical protein
MGETTLNYAKLACLSFFAASSAMAVPPGPPPVEIAGPVDTNVLNTVDANVVNTVDTNVLNTVDANLVTTISSDGLVGLDLSPIIAANVTAVLGSPRRLISISTSIAPDVAGDICNFSVRAGVGDSTAIDVIGLSAMSNGQAATVSRNYDIPIDPVDSIEWEITGTSDACWISLSFATAPSETATTASARALAAPDAMRIEVR